MGIHVRAISYLHCPISTPVEPPFHRVIHNQSVAIMGLSYSRGTLPGMYLHPSARVVLCILHLCIQVDLLRTLVPILA